MHNLDDHLEARANADVLVRAYDCTNKKCMTKETVVEDYSNGIFFGQCTQCGARYLPPDWDAMGKED